MRKYLLFVLYAITYSWSTPKPMESVENYNILIVHGAYGSDKGIAKNSNYPSAYEDTTFLGDATLGGYTSNNRITRWIAENIFEEKIRKKEYENARNSHIYHWRSFTNPANSSLNNARELGYRIIVIR